MTPSARYALAVALTNVPDAEDWKLIKRLATIVTKFWPKIVSRKVHYLIKQNEVFNVPDILKLISIDDEEYTHLMTCLYKNGLARGVQGDQSHEEIHENEEYWKLDDMESKELKKFC